MHTVLQKPSCTGGAALLPVRLLSLLQLSLPVCQQLRRDVIPQCLCFSRKKISMEGVAQR